MSDLSRVGNYQVLAFAYWVILHAFLSSAEFFQNRLFRKIPAGANQFGSRSGPTFVGSRPFAKKRQQMNFLLIVGKE